MKPSFLAKNLLQCGLIVAAGETKFLYDFKGTLKEMDNGIEAYEICTEVLKVEHEFLGECEK